MYKFYKVVNFFICRVSVCPCVMCVRVSVCPCVMCVRVSVCPCVKYPKPTNVKSLLKPVPHSAVEELV